MIRSILFFVLTGLILSISLHANGNNTYGVPGYLWQNTNTIETYNPPIPGYTRSHTHGDRFAGQLTAQLSAHYPSVQVSRQANKDSQLSLGSIVANNMSGYEMVFYGGHGYSDGSGWVSYDQHALAPGSKSYGGWTRWVFYDACEILLNHNAAVYAPMFNGLHAVFGHESNTYAYLITYNCGVFSCSHHRSEDMYDNFANRWVNGQDLWMAWRYSISDTRYVQGGYGETPATVYNTYWPWYGKTFIGKTEYITNMFNGDVPVQTLNHEYVTYGTPSYN